MLVSEEALSKAPSDVKPLARLAGYSVVGCDPTIMGIGPVGAITRIMEGLSKTGKDASTYCDLIEVSRLSRATG